MMATRREFIRSLAASVPLSLTALAQVKTKRAAKPAAAKRNPIVVMETTMGTIKIEVLADKAPVTAKNFLDYVSSGFYDGTIFHRVVPDFVVQGGGYTENMMRKETRPPIRNESKNGLKNLRGTLSMARYSDPHSATSQFFINLKDNSHLDPSPTQPWGYAVFARVIEGMDVVDKMAAVKTTTRNVQGTPFENVPVKPIVIKSARVLK